jgi:sulfur carrier protein
MRRPVSVTINGESRELPGGTTVASVIASLRNPPEGRGVAVAVEGEVVPRAQWPTTELHEGATVEVVAAVQGG